MIIDPLLPDNNLETGIIRLSSVTYISFSFLISGKKKHVGTLFPNKKGSKRTSGEVYEF